MGLVLGFMGVGCCCFSFISWPFVGVSSVLSIGGLIFGFVSMKGDGKPFWLTGIITSGIALILSLLIIVLSVLGIGRMAYQASNYSPPTFNFPTYPAYVPPTYAAPTTPTSPKKVVTSPGNYKVVLESFDESKRAFVLRVLLDSIGLRLSDASKILMKNNLPKDVIKDIDKTSAETIKKLLDDAGAKATVE
jgi:ribosomal protein L7/L12